MSSIPAPQEIECNKRLIQEVSEELELTQTATQHILSHFSDFIARTIEKGDLEGIYVPYLGKFHVKHRAQQYKNWLNGLHPQLRGVFRETIAQKEDLNDILKPDP